MRKVTTASAVILTALTGCSPSSSVPSTQWSFKVPSVGEASTQPTDKGQANKDQSSSAASDLSRKNQLFANAAGNGRMMGPAFEQPAAGTPVGAQVSTVGRPGSQGISNLARTYDLAESAGNTQASTRPDPVAQVRAYLQANSPSGLIDRTPYNSQVYLSSVPQSSDQSNYATSPTLTETFSSSSLSASAASPDYLAMAQPVIAPSEINSTGANLSPQIANSSNYSVLSVSEALPNNGSSSYVATGSEVSGSEVSGSEGYIPEAYLNAEPSNTSGTTHADGLPQLTVNTPSTYTNSPSSAGFTQAVQPEAIEPQAESVGTSILQNLQRSATADIPTATSTYPEAEVESIGTSILQNLQRSTTSESSPDAASVSEFSSPVDMTSVTSALPTRASSVVALTPNLSESLPPQVARETSAYSEPVTLDRLSETMPEREISPLVADFWADNGLSEQTHPLKDLPLSAQDKSLDTTNDVEAELQSRESSPQLISSLLERLQRESSPQLVIYVPIAEALPVHSSQALTLSDATGFLTPETATLSFIDEIDQSNVFSSVLTQSLLASSNGSNVDTSDQLNPAELTVQQVKMRQAKIALAAQQASRLRQRLAWL